MRITDMEITGYGLYVRQKAQNLSPGLNIFFGANEAGKSTCLDFLRTAMFGGPTGAGRNKEPRYPMPEGAKPGGSLTLTLRDGRLWRLTLDASTLTGKTGLFEINNPGTFSQQSSAGNSEVANLAAPVPIDENEFLELKQEVNRTLYAAVYGFSLDQLQDLSSLQDDKRVSEALYGAGFGLGAVSVPGALTNLEKRMEALFKERGSNQIVAKLLGELREINKHLAKHAQDLPEYNQIQIELEALNKDLSEAKNQQELLRQTQHCWQELARLQQGLPEIIGLQHKLANLPLPPASEGDFSSLFQADSLSKAKNLQRHLTEQEQSLTEAQQKCAELERQKQLVAQQSHLLTYEKDCKELLEQKSEYSSNRSELATLQGKINALLAAGCTPANAQANAAREQSLPAFKPEQIRQLQYSLQHLQNLHKEWQALWGHNQNPHAEPGPQRHPKLPSKFGFLKILTAASLAAGLGLSLFGYIAGQPLSLYLGLAFWLLFLGLGAILLPVCQRHWRKNKLAQQAEPLLRLLQPLVFQATEVSNTSSLVEQLNLLSPEHLNSALHYLENLQQLPLLIERASELELKTKTIEHNCLKLQKELNSDIPLNPDETNRDYLCALDATAFLEALGPALAKAQSALLTQERLGEQIAGLQNQQAGLKAKIASASAELSALFNRAQVQSLPEFEQQFNLWQTQQTLLKQQAELNRNLLARAREVIELPASEAFISAWENCSQQAWPLCPEDLLNFLTTLPPEQLALALEQARNSLSAAEDKYSALSAQLGTLQERQRSLRAAQDPEDMLYKKNALQEQLRKATEEWSVAALALHFLKEAKEAFERKHQTAVMSEASRLFSEITAGEYPSLDPSAEPGTFAVLSALQETKKPTELSRGTREQLFLALRLAFIRNRAKTAEPLPLLMDDILVNFDPTRTKRAVKSILSLADQHQIFYFTCHPHMCEMLQAAAREAAIPLAHYNLKQGLISPQL